MIETEGKGGKKARQRKAARKKGKQSQQEANMNRNTDYNPLDCPVCLEAFDDTKQRPHSLPCGHTLCTLCINMLENQGQLTCPQCRISHAVPDGGQFPVCYALESMIRRMRSNEAIAGKIKGKTNKTSSKGWHCLSRKSQSFLQEQETQVLAAITTCQEVQYQLDEYQTTLSGWREKQQQLEERLQEVIDQSRSARELVQREESRAVAKKEETKELEQQLQAVLETMHTISSEQETGTAVPEVLRCTGEAEQVKGECQKSFPNVDIATSVQKVTEDCRAALEAIYVVQAAPKTQAAVATDTELRAHPDQHSTITDRLLAILTLGVMTQYLRSLTQPVKRLLTAGQVFATHQVEGHERHASISLESDQLYLHTLMVQSLPPEATTLQVSQVLPPSPPCTVFMDLSWPGCGPRRVQVCLPHDIPLARHFLLLCTGQRGASYANTNLFRVSEKGKPGERVSGGDYECNNGTGGAGLLPDLDSDGCWKSTQAGAVLWWVGSTGGGGAKFIITTRETVDDKQFFPVFGEVVQGLDVFVEAAQHDPIKEVTVVDCGVVLWV